MFVYALKMQRPTPKALPARLQSARKSISERFGRAQRKCKAAGKILRLSGGNMWESNPPGRLLAPLNGFEDRGAHQHPSTPMGCGIVARFFKKSKSFFQV